MDAGENTPSGAGPAAVEATAPADTATEQQRTGAMHDRGAWAATWTVYIDLDETRHQANWKLWREPCMDSFPRQPDQAAHTTATPSTLPN
eukprot:8806137-Pyramimonas_sp.AAC.1